MAVQVPGNGAHGRRWLRRMPLVAVCTCYLLVNLAYGLYPQDLNRVRLPLAFWLIGGAAALFPAMLSGAGGGALFLASAVTVALALFAVPVWSGHGCWSPDLMSLIGMGVVGVCACAAAAGRVGPMLSSLDPRKAGRAAAILALALAVTVAWAWPPGVFAPQMQPAGTEGPGSAGGGVPDVLWRTTAWGDVLGKLLPVLARPDTPLPRLAAGPGGRLVVVGSLQRAVLRDARTGRVVSALELSPWVGRTADSPAYIFQETQVAGDLLLLVASGQADVYHLAGGRFLFTVEEAWRGQTLLLDDGLAAVHSYSSGVLRRYDLQGNVLWEVALPPRKSPPLDQQIDVYGPDSRLPRVQMVRAGEGFVAAGEGGLVGVDESGSVLWSLALDLAYPTLLASPDGWTVYAAGVAEAAEGGGLAPTVAAVSAAGGTELWRERLPVTTRVYQWAALAPGLALAHETLERSPEADPYTGPERRGGDTRLLDAATGQTVWSLQRTASLLSGMYPVDGDLLIVGERSVTRHDAGTGGPLWSTDLGRNIAYYEPPLRAGDTLVVQSSAFEALDFRTGSRLWRYTPAGSGWASVSDGERLFIWSTRGISCLDLGAAP